MTDGSRTFSKVDERVLYEGKLIRVAQLTFAGPSGTTFERDVVFHPGAVSVVPLEDDGRTVVLVRQYRAALDRELLEIPAGVRDVGEESAEATAQRELEEEIGMRAGRLDRLADMLHSPGFTDERGVVFLGRDLVSVGDSSAQSVEEQHMTVERIALDDVPRLIADGELLDAKSLIGLLLAREFLART